ncbi:MAG TPA: type I-U CRISPR-associated protein Csb2 [Rubrivivax sp.]|nr:type I-U CRISPR-associated protein Csb2 [Rubrivivax sp.]
MPTLLLRFPGRRYHATPWGHHVNEGLVEWPPSPWRLLRALLAVGYTRLGWAASLDEPWLSSPSELGRALIRKLASVLPSYALPPASGAHSRHYMPMGDFKGGRERTGLVFDTWAQVEQGELAVHWDVPLSAEETALLAQLAARLNYLGRSESWVCARLAPESEFSTLAFNCRPCDTQTGPGPGWEQVSLLACEVPEAFDEWREQRLRAALSELPSIPLPDKKKLTAKDRRPSEERERLRQRARAPYPSDLVACLQTDTTWLREHGWSQPPGSRRILYWRRADALHAAALTSPGATRDGGRSSFVLLSLSSASGNNHALPVLARSLPQGEMLHRQMVGARTRLAPDDPPLVLSGCDEAGRPLRGQHGHAHVLSLDLDGDGHIDHLLVWAPHGLDALDQQALRMTRGTYTKGGVGALRLAWSAAGEREDLGRLIGPLGASLMRSIGTGRRWVTATPFVPPRHPKPRGAHSLTGQVRAELQARGLPAPSAVDWLDPQHDLHARALRHHLRVRRNGVPPPVNAGLALCLTFAEEVAGPICLGYGSHYGLGRFECELDD